MRRVAPLLAALGSGALMALALPLVVPFLSLRQLDPQGWLEPVAFVALVPLLWALGRAASPRAAAGLGFAAGLAYFFAAIHWVSHAMTAFGGLSLAFSLFALSLLVGFMAAHWALAAAASVAVGRALGWPRWAVVPPVWTATELLRNYLFTGFPWGNLGYTQARTLPVAQLAALLGVYGIAFLVVLVNAVLADALDARLAGRPLPRRALGGVAAALALVVAGGALRLAALRREMAAAPSLSVGLVQVNVDQAAKNAARDHVGFILDRLVPLTQQADRAGADLVAWPEAAFPAYVRPTIRTFDGLRARLPPLERAHLLLGAATLEDVRGDDGRWLYQVENASFMVAPDLSVLGRYVKNHLVPFGEYVPLAKLLPFLKQVVPGMAPASPGGDLTVLQFPGPGGQPVRVASMICFDAIFPEIARGFARQDPDLLVNPTNDAWYGYSSGPYQFLAIVRLRAVETGRSIARPAYAGVSALILPTGELLPGALEVGPVDPALAPDPDEPARLLVGRVPVLHGRTPVTSIGDAFALACAAASLAALAAAWRRRRTATPA
ncbi:MAG TPA: apolipoprotein N-acyltransferase [Anaeromyxobacteraceae bacterium]|nr:apolipoprotein N-acyltransferase [Anaeromyxobacteraceae bacterium]